MELAPEEQEGEEKGAVPGEQRIAQVVLYVGIGAVFVYLFWAVEWVNEDAFRFLIPGRAELKITEPGNYTIFHESRSEFEGKDYDSALELSEVEITVTAQDSGQQVPLTAFWNRDKYNTIWRQGYSLYNFSIAQPGLYLLEGKGPPEMKPAVLAVSHTFGNRVLKMVLITLALIIATGGLTTAIVFLPPLLKKSRRQ